MNEMPQKIYQQLHSDYKVKHTQTKKHLHQIALGRLIIFILTVLSIIFLWDYEAFIIVSIAGPLFALFLFLVKLYLKKEKEKLFYKNLISINEEELKALLGFFEHFKDGSKFIDIHHPFSFDLDLFGHQSLFQFLNRTTTRRGQKRLADFLQNCEPDSKKIIKRQQAIQELASELNWRQHFAAKGKTETDDQQDFKLIHQWSSASFKLKKEKIIKGLTFLLPILTVGAIILNIFNLIAWEILLGFILSQWTLYALSGKDLKKFRQQFGSRSKILDKYIEMLLDIETKDFQSELLSQLKNKLYFQNQPASHINKNLGILLKQLDYGQNVIISIILNSVFLWDIRCMYKLSKWHQQYHHLIDQWFDVISEFDALSSLGNYNYNHPEWSLPIPQTKDFIFEGKQIGHPLIDTKKRIDNDFSLEGNGKLAIITGANMAGKSTFLRTIGINLLLAMNGCKVCAQKMKFTPIKLYTNMRTTDNLMNDESYFYAELLRLKELLEQLKSGEKLFVIIDEMLKGTNSVDKLNGSKELIKQLISLHAVGIIATHDLKLTELANQYPESIQNQCFEVQLNKDELSFDYRLRPGVTQTMNATFLMKKMGIIESAN